MKRIIRHYFVPHEGNSFRPHAFRMEATLGFFAFLLFIEITFLSTAIVFRTNPGLLADILSGAVINATNVERVAQGITPVTPNRLLETAAQRKADAMAREGYFSHISPNGKTPWAWLDEAGYNFTSAGENLAVNFIDSEDVERAWMDSVTHRANILNNTFREIGIGIAQGMYKGQNAIFVVQFFGTPTPTALAAPPLLPQQKSKPIAVKTPPTPSPLPAPKRTEQVKNASIEIVPPLPQLTEQSLMPPIPAPRPSLSTRLLGSSRATANYIFLILGTIALLGLILALFMRMHVYHPAALVQGSLLLIVVGALFILNFYVSLAHTAVL